MKENKIEEIINKWFETRQVLSKAEWEIMNLMFPFFGGDQQNIVEQTVMKTTNIQEEPKKEEIKQKLCSKCNKTLPFDNFYNHKQSPDGKQSHCKECHKQICKNSKIKRKIKKQKQALQDARKQLNKTMSGE